MKTLFCTLAIAALSAFAANADIITIQLDNPNPTADPGDTVQFFGTITNNDPDDTIFLNDDSFILDGQSLTFSDQLQNVPLSLAPSGQLGDSSGDVELFDVIVSDPLLDAPGTYSGSYTLEGGLDGGALDNLTTVSFSVTTTPEPSTGWLLAIALVAGIPVIRRIRARA